MTSHSPAASDEGASGPYHRLQVARVIDETADARSFVFEIPEALRERFVYRAGQFLTFRVEVGGHRLVRCYSLASAPGLDREHKVTVKRVVDGRVSNWMNDRVAAGDTLEVMHPAGIFCLRERITPIVLFGGNSGLYPINTPASTASIYDFAGDNFTTLSPSPGATLAGTSTPLPDGTSLVVIDGAVLRFNPL